MLLEASPLHMLLPLFKVAPWLVTYVPDWVLDSKVGVLVGSDQFMLIALFGETSIAHAQGAVT